jgi:hypothetical protein
MNDDIKDLLTYMERHSERLDKDIENAQKKNDSANVEYYKGSKVTTQMFARILNDIIKKHDI